MPKLSDVLNEPSLKPVYYTVYSPQAASWRVWPDGGDLRWYKTSVWVGLPRKDGGAAGQTWCVAAGGEGGGGAEGGGMVTADPCQARSAAGQVWHKTTHQSGSLLQFWNRRHSQCNQPTTVITPPQSPPNYKLSNTRVCFYTSSFCILLRYEENHLGFFLCADRAEWGRWAWRTCWRWARPWWAPPSCWPSFPPPRTSGPGSSRVPPAASSLADRSGGKNVFGYLNYALLPLKIT